MKNLVILTYCFPYLGGEQFIESEERFWAETGFDRVYIIPEIKTEEIRHYPEQVQLIQRPPIPSSAKQYMLFFVFFYALFWRELAYLIKNKKFNRENMTNMVKAVIYTTLRIKQLKKTFKQIDGELFVYTYWNDIDFYASCELKQQGIVHQVISRTHGFDCYEERRPQCYMPLKRQYHAYANQIFVLSESARQYFHERYRYSIDKLAISRLGVQIPEQQKLYQRDDNVIRVLSISSCIFGKRIDRIVDALHRYSLKHQKNIAWTHVGSGVLLDELKARSKKYMLENPYFKADFLGLLPNAEVKQHMAEHDYDLFINSSLSEGVPVSIMEAMSFGIPAIAPAVGGIPDLVKTNETGFLLSASPNIDDFVSAIDVVYNAPNYEQYRSNSYDLVYQQYNCVHNYRGFIKQLNEIADE
ncbi:glycosyltransferase [Acinetobacter sp. 194]|uniref:glycosyltransferase n=1 Tax=Acinetobacter shaoyimingii TaxID=2715164 RepID=UPI00140A1A1F|nr:glycosyltransferase [Acinetobacter shaoyimingii]NHB56939.1 glycosyltransferase [Acinetobacter shaoyimingii]